MKKIFIVILNYNNAQDTVECLESIKITTHNNYQCVVVDNKSTDNSFERLSEYFKGNDFAIYSNDQLNNKPLEGLLNAKFTLVEADKNGGYSYGNNFAIEIVKNSKDYDYIWVLNNDTLVNDDTLTILLDDAEKHDYGICGVKQCNDDESKTLLNLGVGIVDKYSVGKAIQDESKLLDINFVVGSSLFISKATIEKIGLLPEGYFLYYEDVDYCFKAKRNGVKLGTTLNTSIVHKFGKSTGHVRNDIRKVSDFIDILQFKNRLIFSKKYLPMTYVYLGLCRAIVKRVRYGLFKRSLKMMVVLVRGILKGNS